MMVKISVQKFGIKQMRTFAKNWAIVQIGGKYSEYNINSELGILQKMLGNFHLGDSGFKKAGF